MYNLHTKCCSGFPYTWALGKGFQEYCKKRRKNTRLGNITVASNLFLVPSLYYFSFMKNQICGWKACSECQGTALGSRPWKKPWTMALRLTWIQGNFILMMWPLCWRCSWGNYQSPCWPINTSTHTSKFQVSLNKGRNCNWPIVCWDSNVAFDCSVVSLLGRWEKRHVPLACVMVVVLGRKLKDLGFLIILEKKTVGNEKGISLNLVAFPSSWHLCVWSVL